MKIKSKILIVLTIIILLIDNVSNITLVYAADTSDEDLIQEIEENMEDDPSLLLSLSVFHRIGIVGDSYSSGELHYNGKYVDKYDISWGQILARKYNFTCTNYSKGGLSTRTWLKDEHGLSLIKKSEPDDLYLLVLGINDYLSYGEAYRGSITDITNYNHYSRYPDSFYGNYGKIIEQIKEYAPNSKMIIFTVLNNPALPHPFDDSIYEIADYYKIPVITQYEDLFFTTPVYTDMSNGHPTALGYSGMACAYERLLVDCMVKNYKYFYDLYMN